MTSFWCVTSSLHSSDINNNNSWVYIYKTAGSSSEEVVGGMHVDMGYRRTLWNDARMHRAFNNSRSRMCWMSTTSMSISHSGSLLLLLFTLMALYGDSIETPLVDRRNGEINVLGLTVNSTSLRPVIDGLVTTEKYVPVSDKDRGLTRDSRGSLHMGSAWELNGANGSATQLGASSLIRATRGKHLDA